MTVLADRPRNDRPQGADRMPFAGPVLGIGNLVEFGLPVGYYVEGGDPIGAEDGHLMLWPYAKLSLLPPGGADHLVLVLQGAWVLPANVGVRYGREFDGWEPHVGANIVFSGGPAGDDPAVTRYQEARQFIMTFGLGATWLRGSVRPTFELGLMRNHYDEGAVLGDFGQATVPRTLYDLYAAGRIRL